jgi:hypothetical protein
MRRKGVADCQKADSFAFPPDTLSEISDRISRLQISLSTEFEPGGVHFERQLAHLNARDAFDHVMVFDDNHWDRRNQILRHSVSLLMGTEKM